MSGSANSRENADQPIGVQPGEPATICAGCGDLAPEFWRDGGWYCHGCASCEVHDSPYCTDPECD